MFRSREVGVLLALILLVAIMAVLTPYFLKPDNIFNVLRGMSTIGIMAIGQTMIIITGGIDLSVGSVLAASAMMTARLMFTGVPLGSPCCSASASAPCWGRSTACSSRA